MLVWRKPVSFIMAPTVKPHRELSVPWKTFNNQTQ